MTMETIHFSNFDFNMQRRFVRLGVLIYTLVSLTLTMTASSFSLALLYLVFFAGLVAIASWIIVKSRVKYTLTAMHLQQHFYHGGWVIKWNNISALGQCTSHQNGWHQPLPWIGIRLKSYTPFLDSICPRIISDILLSQRGLLYVGMQQHLGNTSDFEDIVLDTAHYKTHEGHVYKGLLAMLANRMEYQRSFHGYDLFISVNDLGQDSDDFVGLARRYLAAAEPDHINNQ
jgi:hypothetical protein